MQTARSAAQALVAVSLVLGLLTAPMLSAAIRGMPLQSGDSPALPMAEEDQARIRADQIHKALQTPNLSIDQKGALSLQLQQAMRDAGILGR